MSGAVDSSETFSGFEESMTKRPMYTDQQHAGLAFHRFSLLREKNLLTDAVILSNDDKRFVWPNRNVFLCMCVCVYASSISISLTGIFHITSSEFVPSFLSFWCRSF